MALLDKTIIRDFRNCINSNEWAIYKYRKNKNRWNCICSAMDWIDVSVDYLNTHPFQAIKKNQSIELYSCITCVDILLEAVEKLHRVIFETPKMIFSGDNDCFINNGYNMDDRTYFKTLRACFGAHPTNLHDPHHPHSKKLKRFASWSGGFFCSGDFSVILYSNQLKTDSITIEINYCEIEKFAIKYYNYLKKLQALLIQQYKDFCNKMKKEPIECLGTPIKRLRILQKESIKRLNYSHFNSSIEEIIQIYKTQITCTKNKALVKQYQEALISVIDELQCKLQNMDFSDLTIDDLDYSSVPLSNGWGYWFLKVQESTTYGDGSMILFANIEKIQECFKDCFVFEFETPNELFVLIRAAIYHLSGILIV